MTEPNDQPPGNQKWVPIRAAIVIGLLILLFVKAPWLLPLLPAIAIFLAILIKLFK